MRREKELKFIVTFHTTTEALAMEKSCQADQVPGRLIPVPRQISSGCGLAWCAAAGERGRVEVHMNENGLSFEAAGECWI